jgi:hypothetical protein
MTPDEIQRAVHREMRRDASGTVAERAQRIGKAIADVFAVEPSHATGYTGPHVVLTLDEARHALRCLPDDDVSDSAAGIRAKVRRAVTSAPAFREPSA